MFSRFSNNMAEESSRQSRVSSRSRAQTPYENEEWLEEEFLRESVARSLRNRRSRSRARRSTSRVRHSRRRSGSSKRFEQRRERSSREDERNTTRSPRARYQEGSRSRSPVGRRMRASDCDGGTRELFSKFADMIQGLRQTKNKESFSNSNLIPEFDPSLKNQTINTWLMKVNESALLYEWTDRQIIHYALPKLVGMAKLWYEGLPSVLFNWSQWQDKLRNAFPADENYGQMLSDMLQKRARFGDSLETYFYEKVALINRCGITGKRAAECILHGIDDRSVRVGAEAAQFEDPDKLLAYLRNVKVRKSDSVARRTNRDDKRTITSISKPPIRCYNCKEEGHPVSKCTKPIKRCSKCNAIGHLDSECFRSSNSQQTKTILTINEPPINASDKYIQKVAIDGKDRIGFIDLGSELTLIRHSDAKEIFVTWDSTDSRPMVGFGGAVVNSIGSRLAEIKIQGVIAKVLCIIVPDLFLRHSLLIGQSFSEQPHVRIVKTDLELLVMNANDQQKCNGRQRLILRVADDSVVAGTGVVDVYCDSEYTGAVYVRSSYRGNPEREYCMADGLYKLEGGLGSFIIIPATDKPITFKKNELIARVEIVLESFGLSEINKVESHSQDYEPFTLSDLNFGDITNDQKFKLLNLVNRFRDCFAKSLRELGCTSVEEMTIDLYDDQPIVHRPYRLSHAERCEVQSMVNDLADSGIVRESNSPYASPIILVRKKTGDKRLCIDYRALNKKTIKQHYPLPCMEDQMNRLAGNRFYTTLDLASGYYQIPLTEDSKSKTAFVTPDGQWEFNRMPFGLANAPAVFQRTVNKALGSLRFDTAVAYMDDILVPSVSFDEGLERLATMFTKFREANLTLKLSKCYFFQTSVDFLGFEITSSGIRPGSKKIEAVKDFPTPQNVHNVRQFVGLASFFRKFIKNFAILAKPLTGLLKNDTPWVWGEEQQNAFQVLKDKLISRPILALYSPSLATELHTDASKMGVGAILFQKQESGEFKPVAYYSRQTSPEEQHFSAYELETLAVVSALSKFRSYLFGMSFVVVTDCNSLRATFMKRDMIPRVARWWSLIQEFDCDVIYKSGKTMLHVDALSRNPIPNDPIDLDLPCVLNITDEWLKTVQMSDSEVDRIKNILLDPETNNIVEINKNYCLKNNNVFRVTDKGLKWLVPKGVRWQILKSCHDDIGHFSTEKTLDKVSEKFWFSKMRKFVKKYVQACLECAHSKVPAGRKSGFLHPIPKVSTPFNTIHADHLGPFNPSKNKNKYLLIIIDSYSKFIVLRPVKSTKASTTIRIFKEYFGTFGLPVRLITDRYSSFTGKKLKVFLKDLGVQHIMNAVSTPRANGQVERYNRTVLDSLTAMNHGRDESLWDEKVLEVQWGLNNTINKGTGHTPAEVLFGLRLVGQSEGKLTAALGSDEVREIDLDAVRVDVDNKVTENQRKQKERFDRSRCAPRKFKVGDLVRVERNVLCPGKSRKLVSKCSGPYKVTQVFENDRYLVEDTPVTKKKGKASYKGVHPVEKIHPWLTFNNLDESSDSDLSDKSDSESERLVRESEGNTDKNKDVDMDVDE